MSFFDNTNSSAAPVAPSTPAPVSAAGGTFFKNKPWMNQSGLLTAGGSFFKNDPTRVNYGSRYASHELPVSQRYSKPKYSNNYYAFWVQAWKDRSITDADLDRIAQNAGVVIDVFPTPRLFKVVKEPWSQGGMVTKTVVIGTVDGEVITRTFTYTPVVGSGSTPGKAGDPQEYLA